MKDLTQTQFSAETELFAKIVNSQKLLTIFAKNSILDVSQGYEHTSAVAA